MKLFNTVNGMLEEFVPIDVSNVRMYVCGPTVYDKPHVGNARPAVVFDVLFRLLKGLYSKVTYVSNITDIDDKIINKAKENGVGIGVITQKAFEQYRSDMEALNVLSPTMQPKATEYVEEMKRIIVRLVEKGHAYLDESGDVLFRIESFVGYWKWQKPIDDAKDFVLWKNVVDYTVGLEKEYCWESPLEQGKYGRPGWHIECTAMSSCLLGDMFDIHGGGIDLAFPHHENERAQTCCFTQSNECARYWMHNGLIEFEQGKMSKSLGNIVFLDDVIGEVSGLSVRYYFLQTHYQHTLKWSMENLRLAHIKLTLILKQLNKFEKDWRVDDCVNVKNEDNECVEVINALKSNLNTSLALTIIDEYMSVKQYKGVYEGLRILGLIPQQSIQSWLHRRPLTAEQKDLLRKRVECRGSRDFVHADEIRQQLLNDGIAVEDECDGKYTWYCV